MAHTKFTVEVLTPEGSVFEGEVEQVSTRSGTGQLGILSRHEPLLATLVPTELHLVGAEGDDEDLRFAQGEGYLQMYANRAMVLVEEAIRPEDLDAGELKERLARAEQELEQAEEDSEAHRTAAADKRRAEAFLAIAEQT